MRRLTASCAGGGRFGSGWEVHFLQEGLEAGVGAEGARDAWAYADVALGYSILAVSEKRMEIMAVGTLSGSSGATAPGTERRDGAGRSPT